MLTLREAAIAEEPLGLTPAHVKPKQVLEYRFGNIKKRKGYNTSAQKQLLDISAEHFTPQNLLLQAGRKSGRQPLSFSQ